MACSSPVAIRNRVVSYWKSISLPFPEAGIRLIRQDSISSISVQMTTFKADLDEAVATAAKIPGAWHGAVEVRPVTDSTGP